MLLIVSARGERGGRARGGSPGGGRGRDGRPPEERRQGPEAAQPGSVGSRSPGRQAGAGASSASSSGGNKLAENCGFANMGPVSQGLLLVFKYKRYGMFILKYL